MNIGMLIEDRDRSQIISIETTQAVRDAIGLLASKRIGALPVMQEGRVVGIFSERDVIYRLAEEGQACLDRQVEQVMTSPTISVEPDTSVDQALALMTKRRIRHLPVLDGETMCGFISIGDLVKLRFDKVQSEAEAMRDYILQA